MTALVLSLATPAWGQGTLFVEGDNVGIGTPTPAVRLHIDATGADSNMVRLVRDGAIRYRLENTAVGASWDFNNDGAGNFAISRLGTGGPELSLNAAGRLGLGCGPPDHDFVISPGPSCLATPRSWIDAGSTSFSTSSSRTLKENLAWLEPQGVLDKVRAIPVYEYDFIDGPTDRIGIMAEDFHQIFERGSEKELSGHEMTMALWLAVQELSAQVEELKAAKGEGCSLADGS
jgi:hypothetical protein